jgi:hypothetical protein
MKIFNLLLILCFTTTFTVNAQSKKLSKEQKNIKMDISKLTNETVKKAFNAWQKGDAKEFLSYFTADAKLYDDGNPRNFQSFVKEACGKEKFISIEKVENLGKEITGNFHTESWGDFKTYFKFTINPEGKFTRLDIGQAK